MHVSSNVKKILLCKYLLLSANYFDSFFKTKKKQKHLS